MDELRFAKYQGTGNDFVMLLDLDDELSVDAAMAARICDRRLGVGADGIIRVVARDGGFEMDHRNADGSFARMCGNGARCVGAFLRDQGVTEAPRFDLHTRSGTRRVERAGGDRFTVYMGSPSFPKSTIPMRGPAWETFLEQPLDLGGGLLVTASALSMGNPHLVLFVEEDPAKYHVSHIGPALEHDDRFPEGVNVEFARVREDGLIDARVWERGSGETLACGSGACAVAVTANESGRSGRRSVVRFPGGDLIVERREDGEVLLTGDAVRVFEGTLDPTANAASDLRR
jgi:diaminopimelate epimerase